MWQWLRCSSHLACSLIALPNLPLRPELSQSPSPWGPTLSWLTRSSPDTWSELWSWFRSEQSARQEQSARSEHQGRQQSIELANWI